MVADLYYTPASPPCQSVMVLAKALGVDLNLKPIKTQEGETKTPEFLKLNPQHTVPTLVDDGFSLWESRSIMQYLCDKFDKEGKFYPKGPNQRAIVNRLLFFDLTLYNSLADIFGAFMQKKDHPEGKKKVIETLELLNTFLDGQKWLIGDQLTIADISMHITTGVILSLEIDLSPYSNVQKWHEMGKKEIPHYEIIENGYKLLLEFLKMAQNKQQK